MNKFRNCTQLDYSNGQKMVLDYYNIKQDQRLKQIRNEASGGGLLSQFDYNYAPDGTITKWIQQLGDSPATAIDLHYDKLNQLLAATYRQDGKLIKQFGYHYDKSGNRLAEQINDTVQQAAFNNLNQLTSRQAGGAVLFKGNLNETGEVKIENQQAFVTEGTNFTQTASLQVGTNVVSIVATDDNNNVKTNLYQIAVSPSEAETFEYDLNGNMISRTSASSAVKYDWDGANRLVRVIRHGGSATNISEFTYDGLSRRVRIVEKENNVIKKDNRFVWESTSLVEERNNTGFLTTKRFFNQGVQIGNENYFYSRDHLGSIREMTDASGTVRARYDYDPYGRKTKLEGDLEADFGYTGHYHHAPSDLSLALFRAYDSDLGRFINRDPIEEFGGFNLYGYVGNDPINYVDRDGLNPCVAVFLMFLTLATSPDIANAPGPNDPTYSSAGAVDMVANFAVNKPSMGAAKAATKSFTKNVVNSAKSPTPTTFYRPSASNFTKPDYSSTWK